ncbi:hypothetical protein [Mangrovicoccus sp. HB161399]|uniref:hypothetical protein n=1 Tax=Mangrovicoccus sp. HB161399 TaxID=2720392 RepID=UPI0015540278|nr:hypothetical protein [Mangrovicoccus sp. HB161399]
MTQEQNTEATVSKIRLWSGLEKSTRQRVFVVDLIDGEGGAFNVWTGDDYSEAAALARQLSADSECEIVASIFGAVE